MGDQRVLSLKTCANSVLQSMTYGKSIMSQNIYQMFTDDPVEYNMKHLKTQLFMILITLLRDKGWTQAVAAKHLKVTGPRISNLFSGHLEKFSIDTLLEMLVRTGYKVDATFNPENVDQPLVMSLKKATL